MALDPAVHIHARNLAGKPRRDHSIKIEAETQVAELQRVGVRSREERFPGQDA
jgi:hypothetical protein